MQQEYRRIHVVVFCYIYFKHVWKLCSACECCPLLMLYESSYSKSFIVKQSSFVLEKQIGPFHISCFVMQSLEGKHRCNY